MVARLVCSEDKGEGRREMFCRRRSRVWVVAVSVLVAATATASAGSTGSTGMLDSTSPAPLINEAALHTAVPTYLQGATIPGTSTDIFAATSDEQSALHDLEADAVKDLIADHHLASTDTAAAATWGRPAALAELWGLLLKAAQTPFFLRNHDQIQAVAWMQSVFGAEARIEAYYAGLRYLEWGDFNKTFAADKAKYDQDVQSGNWDDLKTVLLPFDQGQPYEGQLHSAPYGYCDFSSPAGDTENIYKVPTDNEELEFPCKVGDDEANCGVAREDFTCNANYLMVPDFEEFVSWGIDDSYRQLVTDPHLAALMTSVTGEFPFWLAARSAAPPGGFAEGAPAADIAQSLSGITQAISPAGELAATLVSKGIEGASAILAAAGSEVPGLDVVATAIEVAVAIARAAIAGEIPDHLIQLLQNAQGEDVGALSHTGNGQAALYIMFLASTLPQPTQSCGGSSAVCLDAPPVLPTSGADTPLFISSADGSLQEKQQESFSFYDAAQKATHCVYLHGDWFVDHLLPSGTSTCTQLDCPPTARGRCVVRPTPGGTTTQTLDILYTDWDGHEQTAWVVPSGAGGYEFATADHASGLLIPGFCLLGGHCGLTSQIFYQRDSSGDRFEAGLYYGNGVPGVPACSGSCGPSSSTTTVLSWAPPVPTGDDSVTMTATVTRNCATRTNCLKPAGRVDFVQYRSSPPDVDVPVCSARVSSRKDESFETAVCTWTPKVSGNVYATFAPDDTTSTGGSQAGGWLSVSNLPATTATVTLIPSPAPVGAPVLATATVKNICAACIAKGDGGVSGSVTFSSGGQTLCGPLAIQNTQQSATVTCTTSFATLGSHQVVASFTSSADTPSEGSAAVTVTQPPPHSSGGATF
jgi:hypothetical protein